MVLRSDVCVPLRSGKRRERNERGERGQMGRETRREGYSLLIQESEIKKKYSLSDSFLTSDWHCEMKSLSWGNLFL